MKSLIGFRRIPQLSLRKGGKLVQVIESPGKGKGDSAALGSVGEVRDFDMRISLCRFLQDSDQLGWFPYPLCYGGGHLVASLNAARAIRT